MSDLIAGPATGGTRRGTDGRSSAGALPVLLLAALGAAALNVVVWLALFGGFGGGDGGDGGGEAVSANGAGVPPALADGLPPRVSLVVTLRGRGDGEIQIVPSDDVCSRSCERRFDAGTQITVTATPGGGSVFKGWGDTCDGDGSCSFVLDKQRSLTATFALKPPKRPAAAAPAAPANDDVPRSEEEHAAELEAGPDGDCADGYDNDRDGLTDAAQDPECAASGVEAGSVVAPPPAVSQTGECADGRDNDGDGLTDTAQDPDCVSGSSESAKPRSKKRAPSECRDGKDNDADGLIDKAQDPGCVEDSTEA